MQVLIKGLILSVILMLLSGVVAAGSFKVFPLKLNLDQRSKTTLFKLTNTGDTDVTVQLETVKWNQNEDGVDEYEETRDIVYFPKIVKIKPNEQRIIRIGYRGSAVDQLEKTYRIFAQELPELGENVSALNFALRFSVPVFIKAPNAVSEAAIDHASMNNGTLNVFVTNTGTQHLVVKSVDVNGIRHDGQQSFSTKGGGWYVLPGVTKPFSVKLPENECRQAEQLAYSVIISRKTYDGRAPVDVSQCIAVTTLENTGPRFTR